MPPDFMIYGSYGYTGSLLAERALARGLHPLLAGRDATRLAAQCRRLALPGTAFALEDRAALASALGQVPLVINCAGPFVDTVGAMVAACLESQTHYLDVTGEIEVFEWLAARHAEARQRGIVLVGGVGFDVVPGDCMALWLQQRLPDANRLTIAFSGKGAFSRGTLRGSLRKIHKGVMLRKDGLLQTVPSAFKTRQIDFGSGPQRAMLIAWGDLATAYTSTRIPDIETYMGTPWLLYQLTRVSRHLGWLLGSAVVQRLLLRLPDLLPPGPDERRRERGYTVFYGEVANPAGEQRAVRFWGPDGYDFTVEACLLAAERVMAGEVPAGYHTPGTAFGADFFLEVPGTRREVL